jgi:hypothetical protein
MRPKNEGDIKMVNKTKKQQGTKLWMLSLMCLLCLSVFILSACGNQVAEGVTTGDAPVQTEEEAAVATVAVEVEADEAETTRPFDEEVVNSAPEPVEEANVSTIESDEDETVSPSAEADTSEETMNETVTQDEPDTSTAERSDLNVSLDRKIEFMFEDMTFVRIVSEEYARIESVCAGAGLNNIEPLADGPTILIPNAGDLTVDGSNVAIKMSPDSEITFIPRTSEQRIRIPIDLGDKKAGEEVLSLSLAEARQLFASGHLTWTADGLGPYGTGQGLAGHIAECDPLYEEES